MDPVLQQYDAAIQDAEQTVERLKTSRAAYVAGDWDSAKDLAASTANQVFNLNNRTWAVVNHLVELLARYDVLNTSKQ